MSTDNGDPKMTDVTFSSSVVDVTEGPKTVTVTATAHDTGGPGPASGLRHVEVFLSHGNGHAELVKLREDESGNWVGTVTVPRWTKPGEWSVGQAYLRDRIGQQTLYGGEEEDVPFHATFVVVSPRDSMRPVLTRFGFRPNRVNTTHREQKVTFTARARDDMSGVAQVAVGLRSLTSRRHTFARLLKLPERGNTYGGRAVIPRWIGSSDWKVWFVAVVDRADNYALYRFRRLEELGFKRDFKVASRRDTTEPKMVALSRRPGAVDIRASDRTVTVTARVKDTQSGVDVVEASFSGAHGIDVNVTLERVSGTRRNGVWRGTATVHQCPAESGPLSASMWVSDDRGNDVYYPPRELRQQGWPSTLSLLARADAIPPKVHMSRRDVPVAGPLILTFNEPVNGISETSTTVRRFNFNHDATGPGVDGRWRCETGSGTVTNCQKGRVREALFRPTTEFRARRGYVVELNPPHTLALTDLAGNPFDRDQVFFQTGR